MLGYYSFKYFNFFLNIVTIQNWNISNYLFLKYFVCGTLPSSDVCRSSHDRFVPIR